MSTNGHSRLAPSKAYQWVRCTASVGLIEANDAILPQGGGKEADEGTRAHAYLTATLKHTLGQVPDNREMGQIIDELVKYIYSRMGPDDRLLVDQRLPLFYLPSERGTLDVAIIGRYRSIFLDLKYGVNTPYYAEENEQLISYSESQVRVLEQIEEFPPEYPLELIIYQPRDRNDPKVIRDWHVTRGQLAEHAKRIQTAADDIRAKRNLKFCPGYACTFCRAEGICEAKAMKGLEPIADDQPVDVVVERAARTPQLTREQRQRVLASKKDMIAWLEAVEDQEEAELMAGAPVMSFKLVEGKSNRQWKDEKTAAKYLLTKGVGVDSVYPPVPPEIVSPAQGEKALRAAGVSISEAVKKEIEALIEKPRGKPTLVPLSDPRPPLLFDPTTGLNHISDASELI